MTEEAAGGWEGALFWGFCSLEHHGGRKQVRPAPELQGPWSTVLGAPGEETVSPEKAGSSNGIWQWKAIATTHLLEVCC